jgi:hypothetical protein
MMPFAVEQIWHAGRPVRVAEKGSTLALLLEATVRRITAAAASDADVRGAAMKQPNLDRRVRQLIARHKPATLAEILPLCPYQTLLGPLRDIPPTSHPTSFPTSLSPSSASCPRTSPTRCAPTSSPHSEPERSSG